MKVLYTARELFEIINNEKDINLIGISSCFAVGRNPWERCISWIRLYHLKDLITLDILLNKNNPDEPYAATVVYGLWRHRRIGRWGGNT